MGPAGEILRYVALGDSYTIGTGVAPDERWPDQLVASFGPGSRLALVANLAVNGYTSGDVIWDQLPGLGELAPDFVSRLIGVNDVARGIPPATFESNVRAILDDPLGRLPPDRIVTIAIPDYTVTPAGVDYGDPRARSAAIVEANATVEACSAERGVAFVDTYDLSIRAADDRSLVAGDGLHPSGAQYALWVERIRPEVDRLLRA